MTLPASGALKLSQIAAEFGLAATAKFPTAFYGKGGAPASGALKFSDFYGRSSLSVQLTDRTVARAVGNSGSVTTSFRLLPDGTARDILNVVLEQWLIAGSSADVQVRATLVSGDPPSGGSALNAWLDFSAERFWSISSAGGAGMVSGNLLIELRSSKTLGALDSAAITIRATSNTGPGGGGA